jgi:hypothetical protein
MPEIEIFEDKSILVGKRRKGRDETIEDAMKTMERFSDWLADTRDKTPWAQSDPLAVAMLYGMLAHLRDEINRVLDLGGEDALNTYEFFKNAKRAESNHQDTKPALNEAEGTQG